MERATSNGGRPSPPPFPATGTDERLRAERVRAIGREVAAGKYRVSAELVADAVMAFHRRAR